MLPAFRLATALAIAGAGVALSGCASTSAPPPEAARVAEPVREAAPHRPAAALTDARVRTLLPTLANGASPAPGIVTGGQIDSAGLAAIAREGVRTVLDLRAETESRGFDEPRVARGAGLDYVNLPVTAETLDDRVFDRFRALLSDSARAPFLVHCASGNRVGAVLIPHLVLDQGVPVDSAVAAARRVGLTSEPLLEKALDYVGKHPAAAKARPDR